MNKLITSTSKKLSKYAIVFYFCGSLYVLLELITRGYSDISMFFCAGIACSIISIFNNKVSWDFPLILQSIIGGIIITIFEGLCGILFNAKYNIWDYRDLPFTFFFNQCNLFFCLLWVMLSFVAIILSDWLLYWLFPNSEQKPKYKWF